jgi:3-dehydroquinate synthase
MQIKSSVCNYLVRDEEDLSSAVAVLAKKSRVFALIDGFFAESDFFKSIAPECCLHVEATESAKSFERLGPIYSWLLENGFRRDCVLLVAGGGVLQDIGCFVASTLMRGVRWVFIPTTLLAQCDSCIGSKSSINFGKFKNQIGTFYPPDEIILNESILLTLPADEVRSGMGEVIKLHLIAGGDRWQWFEALATGRDTKDMPLREMVRSSLDIKKPFVEEDEFDKGRRNLLNYGHTFGHAYESLSDFGIPHGIAVSLGVLTATHLSCQRGWVDKAHYVALQKLLRPFCEPFDRVVRNLSVDEIVDAMKVDKKVSGGRLTCILTRGPGAMEKVALESPDEARYLLGEFMTSLA